MEHGNAPLEKKNSFGVAVAVVYRLHSFFFSSLSPFYSVCVCAVYSIVSGTV
jgi:hypothetical protein